MHEGGEQEELYQQQVLTTMVYTGRRNKQSRLIAGYVGGGGKSVPSMGGADNKKSSWVALYF